MVAAVTLESKKIQYLCNSLTTLYEIWRHDTEGPICVPYV